jgi:hypothetical protein
VRWTGLTGESKAGAAALFCEEVCMHSSRGSCTGSVGVCMCARGALCGFRALVWWSFALCLSLFSLCCVEPLPLPKGTETCLLQVILIFAFPLAFDRLLKFLLVVSFLFLFSLVLNVCVVNALIKGEIEDPCGSRTGGWSLPGVMSD